MLGHWKGRPRIKMGVHEAGIYTEPVPLLMRYKNKGLWFYMNCAQKQRQWLEVGLVPLCFIDTVPRQ